MTGMDQDWETGGYDEPDEDDGDWRDYDDDDWEPDPEDAEIARADAEYWEHCDDKHGGEHCDCRAPLAGRIRQALRNLRRRVVSKLRRDHYFDEPPF